VHTIFVLRLDTSDAEVIDERVMLEPRSSGPEADVWDCMMILGWLLVVGCRR